MIKTQTYRVTGMRQQTHTRLAGLLAHLTYLRKEAVAFARYKYFEEGVTVNKYGPEGWFQALTHARQCEQWRKYKCSVQRSILRRIAEGYQKFFKKQGVRPRLFKKVRSFEDDTPVIKRAGKYHRLKIQAVGWLRFVDRRGIVGQHKIKRIRVVQHCLGSSYDVQIIYDDGHTEPEADQRAPLGVDFGLKAIVTLSNGQQYAPLQRQDARHRQLTRKWSKAQKYSKTQRKRKRARAKEARRMAVRRKNYLHRVTTDIVRNHTANLYLEELTVKNLMAKGGARKRGLNHSFANQSLGTLKRMLEQKAKRANGQVYWIHAAHTSQDCSACGARKSDLSLSDRTYICTSCGFAADRDVNAAMNVLSRGLRTLPGCRTRLGARKNATAEVKSALRGAAAMADAGVSAPSAQEAPI